MGRSPKEKPMKKRNIKSGPDGKAAESPFPC